MRKSTVLCVAAVLTAVTATPAAAVDTVNSTKLRQAVTVGGILEHERAFQKIARDNDGTRASGTPGYAASAAYVKKKLKAAGYTVKEQTFTFPFFRDLAPATLTENSPTARDFETVTFTYSGSGTVTGALVPTTDVQIPPGAEPSSSSSGCEPGDFPAAPAGPAVALAQRGTCGFGVKAANAQAAGYEAIIIFNEGQEGRTDVVQGTLTDPVDIPALSVSFADGAALYADTQAGPVNVTVSASTETDLNAKTSNLIAETPKGDHGNVIVVGAHLDSVTAGPGINDNGSGSATILEIAEQFSALKVKPRQAVRFAFWGAEEPGLLGSEHYVGALTQKQLAKIKANLNFDMLGSPNYVRFVYDGDLSDTADESSPAPPGSDAIEKVFTDYFDARGLASAPTAFDGRSDYGPFIDAGIPAGGLFSGAEGVKTAAEASSYGGTAGQPYDPCYHQACDTVSNLSGKALEQLGDAAAHAVLTLALSKTGVQSDGSFRQASAARTTGAASSGSADYAGHAAVR